MAVNVPVTTWQDNQGITEFSNIGADFIVDTLGAFLVDTTGAFVVDTGVQSTVIPATVWTEDDSK